MCVSLLYRVHVALPDFRAIKEGAKSFIFAPAELGIREGDMLILEELDLGSRTLTGDTLRALATYITDNSCQPCALSGEGLSSDVTIVSIELQ